MKPNLGYYVQKISNVIQDTEAMGEDMHPCYEEIRTAIDNEHVEEISPERLSEIAATFAEGTQKYEAMLVTIKGLRPPARVMGIHKKFENAYSEYVAGCQEMVASVTDTVNPATFNAAEDKQDKATDAISFAFQRMSSLLLKR